MVTERNCRRLLFAAVFIVINVFLLPSRIGSGLNPQGGYNATRSAAADDDSVGRRAIKIGTDATLWTDDHSAPRRTPSEGNVRIAFRLHDPSDVPRPDKFLSVDTFFCRNRSDLPPSLQSPPGGGRLFDFTTTVSTDLNVLFMGDSLAHQFSQGFEAAVLGDGHEGNRAVHDKFIVKGKQFDCLVTSAPVRGGGVSAFWRYTKLPQKGTRARIMPCYVNHPLWGENFLRTLLDREYSDRRVSGFDAVVVRLPHGWMKAEEITRARIEEVVAFCSEMLGARTVIFTTVGLDNNAITSELWDGVTRINEIVHDVARDWTPPGDGEDGVKHVLVQEFSNFTSAALRENGGHMGYDVSTNDFFFERLKGGTTSWPQSIPMVCANRPRDDLDSECRRNKISPDGIHWCVETVGPRFTASVACLLGCAHNGRPPGTSGGDGEGLRECERECNERFMSLVPVQESWIGNGRTLFASTNTES